MMVYLFLPQCSEIPVPVISNFIDWTNRNKRWSNICEKSSSPSSYNICLYFRKHSKGSNEEGGLWRPDVWSFDTCLSNISHIKSTGSKFKMFNITSLIWFPFQQIDNKCLHTSWRLPGMQVNINVNTLVQHKNHPLMFINYMFLTINLKDNCQSQVLRLYKKPLLFRQVQNSNPPQQCHCPPL